MSTPATNGVKEIFELLRDDLEAVEREFGRDTVSTVPAITDIGEYLRQGGGKRRDLLARGQHHIPGGARINRRTADHGAYDRLLAAHQRYAEIGRDHGIAPGFEIGAVGQHQVGQQRGLVQ